MEKEEKKELTLEEAFDRLDGLMERMESRETSLEDSFKLYQDGMELVKACSEKLENLEQKVLVMNEEGGLDEF